MRYDAKPHSNEPIIPTGWEEEDEDDIPYYYKDILVKPDEPKWDNSSTEEDFVNPFGTHQTALALQEEINELDYPKLKELMQDLENPALMASTSQTSEVQSGYRPPTEFHMGPPIYPPAS